MTYDGRQGQRTMVHPEDQGTMLGPAVQTSTMGWMTSVAQNVGATLRGPAGRQRQDADEEELRRREKSELEDFLFANGFEDINAKRRKNMMAEYPLHLAVRDNNPQLVDLMLRCGASRDKTNSWARTPLSLAKKLNQKNSHLEIIRLLQR